MPALEPRDGERSPVRISDGERNDAVERLNVFFAEGRLNHDEYSVRLDDIYGARTDLELNDAFRGLPRAAPAAPGRVARRDLRSRIDLAVGVGAPGALCTAIWAMTTQGYFWPEWVWLATAISVVGGYRISRRRRRPRRATRRITPPPSRTPEPVASGGHDGRAILTAVFVDIVGSTQKAAAVGDAPWREILRRFEHLVDGQLVEFGGHKLFTKGDEVVATFRSPAQAINYACALRQAVQPLDLDLRAGIHTGEVEGSQTDLSGITLHIGQRVSAIATPGQILVSSTVRDIAYGSGIAFSDCGEHELTGLTGNWHLYSVGGAA
ncbi:MAG TPA: DUF1707 domain-containing protein [Acidimicrobiales bacterium]|jgi:class 3 adenylate cyclase|nr:DUF1707 domain-containing protein [Acidimicrobiales bacterium]